MCFFKKKIRTRFAPSPTGFLHIGGLRTALFNYIFARQNNGKFILRIEDTDQARKVEGAIENLLKALNWAGLKPDEGVVLDKNGKAIEKGKLGPYQQSNRLDIYKKYAQELVDKGHAYYCFCSTARLEELRKKQETEKGPTRYDGHCLKLSASEIDKKMKAGEQYVIRMKIPADKEIKFKDLIRGEVKFNTKDIDEQVLMKSDGFPTYHLASIVDDHLMKMTHVIRGEEWLSSTPKHILLYQYFGWRAPKFAHLPLILNTDKSKLSKRQNDVAVEDYRDQGYLPEALVNFCAFLGWNPGTEQEIYSIPELIKDFSFAKIHKAGAVFNREKLNWLNSEYFKKMPLAEFKAMSLPILQTKFNKIPDNIDEILELEKERIVKIGEVGEGVKFLFIDNLEYSPEILIWKKSDRAGAKKSLQSLLDFLMKYSGKWKTADLEKKIIDFIQKNNLKNGDVLWPMRVALSGEEKSPTPFEIAAILGKEKTIQRLNQAINLLN